MHGGASGTGKIWIFIKGIAPDFVYISNIHGGEGKKFCNRKLLINSQVTDTGIFFTLLNECD